MDHEKRKQTIAQVEQLLAKLEEQKTTLVQLRETLRRPPIPARTLNRKTAQEMRDRYMRDELSHQAYYLWLASFIGATKALVPFSDERIAASTDEHLNDLALVVWDVIGQLAHDKGLAWSLSDTVSVLKALARTESHRTPHPEDCQDRMCSHNAKDEGPRC